MLSSSDNLKQIVVNQFTRVAQNERCSFLGNVNLGSAISLPELRELYHVVSTGLDVLLCMETNWTFHHTSLGGRFGRLC